MQGINIFLFIGTLKDGTVQRIVRQSNVGFSATEMSKFLSVGLGNTLKFVLFLDGVAVGAALCSIDELIGQALCNRLNVTERGFAGSSAQQPDSLKITKRPK